MVALIIHVESTCSKPFYSHALLLNGISIEAVIGLESFTVSEDVGVVELCAHVFEPDIECPIEFPFDIVLSTTDRTAGTYLIVTY